MLKKIATALLASLILINQANAETWRDVLPQAKEVGQGDFRWLFFKIYSAKLWSEHLPFDLNKPFALQLIYDRKITSEEFAQTSIDEIKRIFGTTYSEVTLQRWYQQLHAVFPNVNQGDQLIGVYLPSAGCRFYDKNKLLGAINDPQLAHAFFSIWLDERTRDKNLRISLLGASK